MNGRFAWRIKKLFHADGNYTWHQDDFSDRRWKRINRSCAFKTLFSRPDTTLLDTTLNTSRSFIYMLPKCINTVATSVFRKNGFRLDFLTSSDLDPDLNRTKNFEEKMKKSVSQLNIFLLVFLLSMSVFVNHCQGLTAGGNNWNPRSQVSTLWQYTIRYRFLSIFLLFFFPFHFSERVLRGPRNIQVFYNSFPNLRK